MADKPNASLHEAICAASNEIKKAVSAGSLPFKERISCGTAVRSGDGGPCMDILGSPKAKIGIGAMTGGKRGPFIEMATDGDDNGMEIEFIGVANIDSADDIDAAANEACEKLKLDWKEYFGKKRGDQ